MPRRSPKETDPDRQRLWQAKVREALRDWRHARWRQQTEIEFRNQARSWQQSVQRDTTAARRSFATLRRIAGADHYPARGYLDPRQRTRMLKQLSAVEGTYERWLRWYTIPQPKAKRGRSPLNFYRRCRDIATAFQVPAVQIADYILQDIRPKLSADEQKLLTYPWHPGKRGREHIADRIQHDRK